MFTRNERRHERPDRRAVLGSAGVHVAALALTALTMLLRPEEPVYIVYEMEIISPDALELGELTPPPPEDFVVETPDETEAVEVEETPDPVVEDEVLPPEPEPEEEEQQVEEEQAEPEPTPPDPVPDTTESRSPDPDPEVEDPGEDINVRMEGLQRDYPEYYEGIVFQMRRCFRPPRGTTARGTVRFYIERDGSVSDIEMVEESGDLVFDLLAIEAVECAGNGRLGPLPTEMPFDRLPIQFRLDPSGTGGTDLSLQLREDGAEWALPRVR